MYLLFNFLSILNPSLSIQIRASPLSRLHEGKNAPIKSIIHSADYRNYCSDYILPFWKLSIVHIYATVNTHCKNDDNCTNHQFMQHSYGG